MRVKEGTVGKDAWADIEDSHSCVDGDDADTCKCLAFAAAEAPRAFLSKRRRKMAAASKELDDMKLMP